MKTSVVKKFSFIRSVAVFSGVLLFGIVFLTAFLLLQKPIPENYVETSAKIVKIEATLSPTYDPAEPLDDAAYDHTVFVEYSFGGKTFSEVEYPGYDSSMKEGGTVTVFVNPDDPSEFMSDSSGNLGFIIAGVVVILIGAGGLGYTIFKKVKEGN